MNICFLSSVNPFDIKSWSGTLFYIASSLAKQNSIQWVGNQVINSSSIFHSKNAFYPEFYAQLYGSILSERISRQGFDIVIVRDYFFGAYLDVNMPIVYVGDTTFRLFKTNLNIPSAKFEKTADDVEKRMIEKADCIILSSNWAKTSAINDYHCNKKKVKIVEFGANIPNPIDYNINIQMDICNLVFIGRNWMKKGGDKVLSAYKKLKNEGFPCALTIIGSTPPEMSDREDSDLTIIPFLDKSKPEHLNRLCSTLKDAHFLVLPTEFDAFGIVFCEASAYGVPSIAADVGGVSQPIREGVNGFLLPPTATAEDYAEKIKTIFSDRENYIKLRASSRKEYETP